MTENFFFYFYSVIALLSAGYIAFSDKKKSIGIYFFLASSSGLLFMFNAGYISFVIITASVFLFSYYKLTGWFVSSKASDERTSSKQAGIIQIIIVALTGGLCASLGASTIWQSSVFSNKEITVANLGELIGEYFVIYLVILVSSFLITDSVKWRPR